MGYLSLILLNVNFEKLRDVRKMYMNEFSLGSRHMSVVKN